MWVNYKGPCILGACRDTGKVATNDYFNNQNTIQHSGTLTPLKHKLLSLQSYKEKQTLL